MWLCHPSRHAGGDLMRFDEKKKNVFLCPFIFYLAVAVFLIVCIYFVTIIKSHDDDDDDGNDKDHPMNGTLNIVFFCCSFFLCHILIGYFSPSRFSLVQLTLLWFEETHNMRKERNAWITLETHWKTKKR
jgi:hypothetical protein